MTVPDYVRLARHELDLDDDGHEDILTSVTTETDDTLVLAPDGAGGVEFRAETGGGGGGAPTTADYLVGTSNGGLSAEIVVGTTPGGELGGTWASPTVDATHSGSSHASLAGQSGSTDVAVADGGTGASTQSGARTNLGLVIGTDVGVPLTVEEVDGSPTDSAITKIKFPNGTLGIAGHVATYTPAIGGGSGSALYPFDTNYFAETKPVSPNATYDDEWDDTSGMSGAGNGLAAKWAWRNQGSSTITYTKTGWGTLSIPASASSSWSILEIAAIADGTYDMKISQEGASFGNYGSGMVIIDRTNGDFYCLARHRVTSTLQIIVQRWTNVTTFSATITTAISGQDGNTDMFFRLIKASTALQFFASTDGIGWEKIGDTLTSTVGETGIGFGAYETNNKGGTKIHIDYFRKVA